MSSNKSIGARIEALEDAADLCDWRDGVFDPTSPTSVTLREMAEEMKTRDEDDGLCPHGFPIEVCGHQECDAAIDAMTGEQP